MPLNRRRAAEGSAGALVEGDNPVSAGIERCSSGQALSTTKRLPVGPPRGRSWGRIHVARRGSGSTRRSVARASCRRKAHRIVHSLGSFTGDGRRRSRLERPRSQSSARTVWLERSSDRGARSSIARTYPGEDPGRKSVRSGGSGRRRRETSCPSIHRGSVSTPSRR